MDEQFEERLKEHLKRIEKDWIVSMQEMIRIPSVIDESQDNLPFGENINHALKKALEICDQLGFRTYYDPQGYYGYAEIGEGEELVGILGHLDVVPPGSEAQWDHAPFDPVIIEGKMYGRGTQDDKGPTFTAIFAAKALLDMGVSFPKRLRFIFGMDEETLWRCMKAYVQKEEIPTYGFTPDSKFPLIYAEKGVLQVYLEGKNESLLRLKGGSAFNSVPDTMVYTGPDQDSLEKKLKEFGYEYESIDHGLKVIGKAAHAQVTEQGINAISRLAIALAEIKAESKLIQFINAEIKEDPYATNIFGDCEDTVSGKLKFNIAKINMDDHIEQLSIDIRIPVTVDKKEIVEKLTQTGRKYGLNVREHDWLKSIYIPVDHFLIQTLMEVYRDVTGDVKSLPISSGGATYARAMDNFVAFGATFPNCPSMAHQPNEHILLEELFLAMEIYAKAIFKLTRL